MSKQPKNHRKELTKSRSKTAVLEDIENYINWFNERINFIAEIKDDSIQLLVYCSLLDALAKCVYCDKKNRDRFTTLLECFGNNNIWSRVSLIHFLKIKIICVYLNVTLLLRNIFSKNLNGIIHKVMGKFLIIKLTHDTVPFNKIRTIWKNIRKYSIFLQNINIHSSFMRKLDAAWFMKLGLLQNLIGIFAQITFLIMQIVLIMQGSKKGIL